MLNSAKNNKQALKKKIIGGVIVAVCLFLLFGEHIVGPFTWEKKYLEQMNDCLGNTKYLQAAGAETAEGKICACGRYANPLPSVSAAEKSAWRRARNNFYIEAKQKYQLAPDLLVCELADRLK